ncbi:MAG TPA: SDR family oxidoreductase [Desulfobacterales bacterium]|nr:SDR family oxidoreductase [Desulfobacterales bacterium]
MEANHCPVAIVGMSCFFPKSAGLKAYWRLLLNGQDAIAEVPPTHWSRQDYYDPDPRRPDHVHCSRGGFLSPVSFDPSEFGIPPSTIEATDTSQLLALAAARQAIEDAGLPFDRSRTSVVLGVTGTQELVIPLGARLGHPHWRRALSDAGIAPALAEQIVARIADAYVPWQENSFPGLLGNVVAGRISNRFDLGGTNCVVDAACASSMAAVHLAMLELACGRSDTVITGGVDTLNDIFMHMCFAKTQALSTTGDARPFSANADGTVLGEGLGLIVLKRLPDAERDGNRIYAVIRGIGASSDGRSQSIYAPRAEGQAKALEAAYALAGIDPATVALIEAHGTGTRIGDKVEFQALCQVLGKTAGKANRCALGSVKSMIGHTKAAAGSAGLMKAALALHHKVLLPTLKADEPDPALNIADSPFYLSTRSRPWFAANDHPRRAGVSSFGFGGSNFHVVLEEYRPEKTQAAWDGSVEILAFSADDPQGLVAAIARFKALAETPLADAAFAAEAARTRSRFSHSRRCRLLVVVEDPAAVPGELNRALQAVASRSDQDFFKLPNVFCGGPAQPEKVAFLFPGQGSQYAGMGRDLTCLFPAAMAALETANRRFAGDRLLGDFIHPRPGVGPAAAESALRATDVAQPAIGMVSLALLRSFQEFGLAPDAVAGHSFGELTALCAAGWMDEDTFLDLAIARGQAMAGAGAEDRGTMLAVRAPLAEIEALLKRENLDVVLANRNGPAQGVLSGSRTSIAEAARVCRGNGWSVKELPVGGAFHSPLMRDAQATFLKKVLESRIVPTPVTVFSNSTAAPYPTDADTARQLLGEHLLQPVDFAGEIEAMYRAGVRTFLEIGPKPVLSGLVSSILKGRSFQSIAIDASAGKHSGVLDLAKALCHLAALGYPVRLSSWESPAPEPRPLRMQLPISGANFRNPRPEKVCCQPAAVSGVRGTQPKHEDAPPAGPGQGLPAASVRLEKGTMAKDNSDIILDAMRSVQDGLKTIQAIQIQTAQAHQKFLETQSEATRILLELVRNTGRLAEAPATGRDKLDREIAPAAFNPPAEPAPMAAAAIKRVPPNPLSPPTAVSEPKAVSGTGAADATANVSAPSVAADSALVSTLLAVVSELTGYPAEMLGLDMDIEADLGIDSIKRVEILSTLEERSPGLPAIAPEDMGRLKTLAQIIAFLGGGQPVAKPWPGSEPAAAIAPPETRAVERQALHAALLAVVSELTGYPAEMLGLDMDIEADLGIDSIKRVEILSALEERSPGLPAIAPEEMGRLKTLGQIIELLSAPGQSAAVPAAEPESPTPGERAAVGACALETVPAAGTAAQLARRQAVTLSEAPPLAETPIVLPKGRKVFVTDDRTGLSQAITAELGAKGINTVLVSIDILHYKKDMPHASGLVIVPNPKSTTVAADLKHAFELAKSFAPDLMESARLEAAFFATVTRMDGAFGFSGQPIANPMQGALAGLAKTAAVEWPEVRCHALDVAPGWTDQRAVAQAVVAELMARGPVEIGLNPDARLTPALMPQAYPDGAIDITPGELVVISGGARGITAACALELTRRVRPTLVLLGRSPEPAVEPEWMQVIEEPAAIKKALLKNEFAGMPATPAEVERRLKLLIANREISRNLEALEAAGAVVHYHAVDVRDAGQVKRIIEAARTAHGPVRALIHGAGVLEDRLIVDKSPEQFERVFDTKVKGFQALLAAVPEDDLKVIVAFSSVTARIGNKGQADYAMANEALNTLAWVESLRRPDCRVVSVNWGPWECGMVTPSLKREFERQGVTLLPAADGALSLLQEMARDSAAPVEVVIGGTLNPATIETVTEKPKSHLAILFEREIDAESYPILKSHVIDGKPVVPMAMMAEWFGHGALHENPGLVLHGLEEIRILNGIRLSEQTKLIRLLAGKAQSREGGFEVELELRNGVREGKDIIHSRARAILAENLAQPPEFSLPEALSAIDYPRSASEIYEKILFHGSRLHGLRTVRTCSAAGMVADVSGAPSPNQWMQTPLRNSWLCDPLALDSAFQMASLWCYELRGCVSLPVHVASYRQFRPAFPAEGVTIVLEVQEATDKKMRGDFTFLDASGAVVARLVGYEAVMDPLLNRAFKPNGAPSQAGDGT